MFEWFILAFCTFNNWPFVFPRARKDDSFFNKVFLFRTSSHELRQYLLFFFFLLISFAVIWSQPNCSRTEPWKMMALWCLYAHWSHTVCLPTEINTPSEKVLAPFKIAPAMRSVPVGVLNDTSSLGYAAKWRTGNNWPSLAGSMAPDKVAAAACRAIYLKRNVLTLTGSL